MEKCIICNGTKINIFSNYLGEELIECLNCGYVAKNKRFIDYTVFPETYFEPYDFDRSEEIDELLKTIPASILKLKEINLLEIGCGTGVLLNEFKKKGINVYGYEPATVASTMAKEKYGILNIRNEYFKKNNFNIKFNIILLYDVLEHLYKPFELFRCIREVMTNDCVLVVKSGNPASFNAKLYPPNWSYYGINEHISFFSKKALSIFLARTDLKIIKYYKFQHAYGGINYLQLLKNIYKSFIFRLTKINSNFHLKHNNILANDHFIAIIKRNTI